MMKSRVTFVAGLGALLLGLWLGTLLKGPGAGGETGGEDIIRPDDSTKSADAADSTDGDDATMVVVPDTSPVEFVVLHVLVDQNSYRMGWSDDAVDWETATLEEITREARKATGDSDGFRIKLHHIRDAQVGAQNAVYTSLEEIGIERREIDTQTSPLEIR